MITVICGVDELGGIYISNNAQSDMVRAPMGHGEYKTMADAVQAVKDGVIPGQRGVGCFVICVGNRQYSLVDEYSDLVERFDDDGNLVERVDCASVAD